MAAVNRFSLEVRDRAICMVTDHRGEYASQWAACQSVTQKFGTTPETLRVRVRQAQINSGVTEGVARDEKDRSRQLERENAELRRANEILRAASIFFVTEMGAFIDLNRSRWGGPADLQSFGVRSFNVVRD